MVLMALFCRMPSEEFWISFAPQATILNLICDAKSAWYLGAYAIRVVFLFVRFLIRLGAKRVFVSFDCRMEMCSCLAN